MAALIAGSAVRTCLGEGATAFASLLRGIEGSTDLRRPDARRLNVLRGFHIKPEEPRRPFQASDWLVGCIGEALAQAAVDPDLTEVVVIVGTGLRELPTFEQAWLEGADFDPERLHFGNAVREAFPSVTDVITLANACSASGHALALAQDLVETGQAVAVVAAGVDSMTASMLAMIGRVCDIPAEALRPFDSDRTGTLLGDGAAAAVVVPEGSSATPLARLLASGLSCDAHHETAADFDGIWRAIEEVFARSGRTRADVDLVVAHGTGTRINDALESQLIRRTFEGTLPGPLVTAVKGAVGHTSGAAALVNVDVAIRCLREGRVPPVVGLRRVLEDGRGLRLVHKHPVRADLRLALVNAFGFGGVNAVTMLERVA
jgi:3-oxoacyl-[acyl-carrier-protein] synthase II